MGDVIRLATAADVETTYAIYFDAVRHGTAPLYSSAEALAWVPSPDMEDWWPDRITGGITWIAERDHVATGFLTYCDGHLDLFFTRPGARGDGTANALYDAMIAQAREEGRASLTTHASHLARRFLEPRGWRVVATETALRNGTPLTRFAMGLDRLD